MLSQVGFEGGDEAAVYTFFSGHESNIMPSPVLWAALQLKNVDPLALLDLDLDSFACAGEHQRSLGQLLLSDTLAAVLGSDCGAEAPEQVAAAPPHEIVSYLRLP